MSSGEVAQEEVSLPSATFSSASCRLNNPNRIPSLLVAPVGLGVGDFKYRIFVFIVSCMVWCTDMAMAKRSEVLQSSPVQERGF